MRPTYIKGTGNKNNKITSFHKSDEDLPQAPGVYLIYCELQNGKHKLIDVGESFNIKNRILNHDRQSCWNKKMAEMNANGLIFGIIKLNYPGIRKEIEKDIREEYGNENLCGDR